MPQTREVALDHYAQRQAFVNATAEVATQMWAEVDPRNIVNSWAQQVPELTAVVSGAQLGAARQADPYTTDALEAEGADPEAVSPVDPAGFSGHASDGRGLMSLLTHPVVVTLLAIQDGMDVLRAMGFGRTNLEMLTRTQVADAGRLADQTALTARPAASGYVRVAVGNSCARCLILAGKHYDWNAGFKRHPACDCIHVPRSDPRLARLMRDPRDIYDDMTRTQRLRAGFTLADQQALRMGADLEQIVNARHRPDALFTAGGRRLTREGTTRRGLAGRRKGVGRGRQAERLTPDQIFAETRTRAEALDLLFENGYLLRRPELAGSTTVLGLEDAPMLGRGRGAVGIPGVPAISGGVAGVPGAGGIAVRQVFADAKTNRALRTAIADEYRRVTGNDLFVVVPSDASLQTMREHAEGLLRSAELFPDARLDYLGAFDEAVDTYAEAAGSAINFNAWWGHRGRRDLYLAKLQGDVDVRWHPRGFESPAAVAVHEFGHILDIETLAERIHPQVRRAIERRATMLGIEPDDLVAREISRYAGEDFRETVAEAFTDVVLNGPNASVLSREIFDILEAEYRRGGFTTGTGAVARATAAPDLSKLKVAELRALATKRGITIPARAKKADIIALLDEGGTARSRAMVPEARARQATLDRSRSTAELLSEVDELLSNQASVRALRHRIEARAKLGDVPPATIKALLAAVDDPVKLRAAMAKAAKGAKLTPTTPLAGEVVPFNRKLMQSLGEDIGDGELVRIVRPGYSALVGGKRVDLVRGGVFKLDATEATAFRKAEIRRKARERQQAIAQADGTAKLLAEVDELLSKKASATAIRERLSPALIEPEQLFANADRAVLDALRAALDSGDMAKVRSTVTRLTTKAKLKPVSKAGAKVKFDPDTMEPVGGVEIPKGAQVVVVTRGSTVVADGETVVLTKPRVAPTGPSKKSPSVVPTEVAKRNPGMTEGQRKLYDLSTQPVTSTRTAGEGYHARTEIETTARGQFVRKTFERREVRNLRESADAEELATVVARALGIETPDVVRVADNELLMSFVDNAVGGVDIVTSLGIPADLVSSAEGRLMGLFDLLINNGDRNAGGWFRRPDGSLVAIDHGYAWTRGQVPKIMVRYNEYFSRYLRTTMENEGTNGLPRSVMVALRDRLSALRSEFARLGREDWHREMMESMDQVVKWAQD